MWKKYFMISITFIGILSIGYISYNTQVNAAPALHPYYDIGDVFERTGTDKLSWGGMNWKLVYTDTSTHDGYLLSDNAAKVFGFAPMASEESVRGNYVDNAVLYIQSKFNVNLMDDTIKMINKSGQSFVAPSLMSLVDYLNITGNESNNLVFNQFNNWGSGLFWMNDTTNNDGIHHLIYWKDIGSNPHYQSYQWVHYDAHSTDGSGSGAQIRLFYKIKLPQQGILKSVSSSLKISSTITYADSANFNGNVVASIDSIAGDGPYHFYVYDTNALGNSGDYTTPSAHFSLSSTRNMDGTTQVVINDTHLTPGDYYVKVRIVDESTNERLYYNPGDFTDDPYRTKETDVIHIRVNQEPISISFQQSNQTKKSIAEATVGWSEPAIATPNGGVNVTYSKVSGDIGLIDIDPNTGMISYTGGGAYGKVTIRATADDDSASGEDNYISAFAEKEIIIYSQVNGSVVPHANSSDVNTPTFTTGDSNVKTGGTIATIKGSAGTPDNVTSGGITYTYGLKSDGDGSFFEVNASTGVITTKANLSVGSYHITVTVADKWSTKEIPVTINVGVAAAENLKFYENSTSNTVITTKSARATDTGVIVYATVRGSSNTNPVKYSIQDGSTNVIEVNQTSGAITIHGVGTVVIVAEKQGAAGQADAITYLTFTVTAGTQNFIYTDSSGNELPKTSDKYQAISEVYAPSKTFQLYTTGNPPGSSVTYRLKAGSPTDVISVDSNGLVHVLNASISPSQIGKVIVEATSHDPSGNYSDSTIEVSINITKANQTVSFAGVTYAANGSGQVTPVIIEQDISSNEGGVTVNDTTYFITIDPSIATSIAWTNDVVNIDYCYSGDNGLDIPLHVEKPGNRNYNKAEADGLLHIMGPNESSLAINRPGRIIYGDHFTIRSLQDDSSSTGVNYTFTVDNTTYISNPTVSGNMAEFDALKYSGSTNINISVTRTADGELPLSKTITVQVLPKPIEIIIDDKEKYKGEQNPVLTYQEFRNQLVSWNGVRNEIQEHDILLSTTANTNSNAGNYPIKGDSNLLNNAYPNYSFTFREGTLKVKEEVVRDDWYHLEEDDGSNTVYTGNWTNQNVNIISDHSEYKNMSLDQSTWRPNKVTVTKEGETNQSFWMKKDSGAITKEKKETIKIDKTAPKVKGIKAKDTNNKLQDIINKLSGGIFFKPGKAFEITTDDSKDNLKVSGTKEIAYKVYQISDGTETEIKNGTLTVTNEKASITISETVGKYKVCVIPTDNAGNTNKESCHEVELKKIDVDVDKDGKPDFNDPDGDGCPDLNIKWKDPNDNNKWIIINGDRDYDGIPDLNIDSDGDGKADLNIDTDYDDKPDLNLVILKKTQWKPTKCVKQDIDKGILEEYCTGTSVKAAINIDTDNDGIPNINIDINGDMKADYNIDKNHDGTADINIGPKLSAWNPKKDYQSGNFSYDSIGKDEIKPELNIDTDGDGLPDINLDIDGDGIPELNVDTDGDHIPDINIDSTGDGKPNINIDIDNDGTADENIMEIKKWKPEKNIDGDFPYDTMNFDEPNKPSDPNKPDQSDNDKPNTSVKGMYHLIGSIGGANTGDDTLLFLYIGICLSVFGLLLYMIRKEIK